ncbi:glycosyltransferase [Halorussus sp. MSC15.2]|uniref:glycosyltransferase n=1 Tax=Halorussus sp. MSC15.2 TaxID=2283638 RepID=UPI0013D396B5|nr:glycosyltransferase [Halorussus sp. MSC15.2]NEU58249.1 glycosyltransferase [Halorussus sp. MSC15.2]
MRVLLIPELYRPDDPTANGTLGDAATWVEGWLDRDPALHVYWLVPPQVPDEAILADRERVTAIRAEPFGDGGDGTDRPDEADIFTEGGYSWAELDALKRAIYDRGAYLDAVVDQRRTGRFDLRKWLCQQTDRWAADVVPFDVIANVHDLQVPFKYRYCSYRDEFQSRMAMAGAVFADGVWFKAGVDADRLRERATEVLRPEVVEDALDDAIETGSPIDLSGFEESYADAPEVLHLAGSLWEKKRADRLLAVGERLHEEFGVETLLTSMEQIPDEYASPEWVETFPEADRETYETALRRGDLAVCASEYETMARTPFEQAASGQVLVLRDEPWIYDCVPDDYRLVGDPDDLADIAVTAVRNWDRAVRENRRLVARVARVRDPDRSARRTHRDLRERVQTKRESYDLGPDDDSVRAALADSPGAEVSLDDLRERTADYTDDALPVTESADYALADLVYALRSLGYRDAGNPGTPTFVRR